MAIPSSSKGPQRRFGVLFACFIDSEVRETKTLKGKHRFGAKSGDLVHCSFSIESLLTIRIADGQTLEAA